MATTNTSLYNKQISSAGASAVLPGPHEFGAKIHTARIETTVAALGATGDILNLCQLPVGAQVMPGYSKISCESPGTTVTVKIGDGSDDDRYMASKALGGSVQDIFWTNSPGVDAYTAAPVVAGYETITLTSITIGTPTSAAKVVISIAYKLE
jgi:hypothetical protein